MHDADAIRLFPEDYVTVRYKTGRSRSTSVTGAGAGAGGRGHGYTSEPEQNYNYDSDASRYATLDRRRQRLRYDSESGGGSPARTFEQTVQYHIQPGRIENYEPGQSVAAVAAKPVNFRFLFATFNQLFFSDTSYVGLLSSRSLRSPFLKNRSPTCK